MGKMRKKKRSQTNEDEEDVNINDNDNAVEEPMSKTGSVSSVREARVSSIRNKMKRMTEGAKLKREKKKAKRARQKERREAAEALGAAAPPRLVPKTIDSMRTHDVTFVRVAKDNDDDDNKKNKKKNKDEKEHDDETEDNEGMEEDQSSGEEENQSEEESDNDESEGSKKDEANKEDQSKDGEEVLEDAETEWDIANDEFADYFNASYEPKVLITSADNPHAKTLSFIRELARIIPNSSPHYRHRASLKKTVKACLQRGYTDLIVVNEDNRTPNGLVVSHLPDGPTAHFRLSNVKLAKDIKKDWRKISSHRPEVIVNNFQTRLGHTVARMLASLFHYEPNFRGRRCVTFHNQRDYIFFRHHMYDFKSAEKVRLRDLGPRFTLRLRSLQKGSFDSKTGEYVWIVTDKRHQLESNRRTFHL